ncbi:MAG: MoaD/ThiS family protein [Deltaproteobacteria bacterium]|nr:MoaD/ThiS family protein [Deltaproteobacteria bacterium]
MPVTVRVPRPLRELTGGQSTVEARGKSVEEVLSQLEGQYPGIGERLYEKQSKRPLFHIYLNEEDIRILDKKEGQYVLDIRRKVKDGDQLAIIPPIAGGCRCFLDPRCPQK